MLGSTMSPSPSAARHYAREGALTARILSALTAADKDLDRLTAADLAPYDQFHSRGSQATAELAQRLDPQRGELLLELGCGIGGPARWLASEFGCQVVGLDLTEVYCQTAQELSQRVRLEGQTRFLCGDALHLPFPAAAFNLVWTQHAAMNIADKARLYREVARVLKPGGRFGLYDIMAGPAGEPHFPVPWAGTAEWNHLVAPEAVRETIRVPALRRAPGRDLPPEAKAWHAKAAPAHPPAAPP